MSEKHEVAVIKKNTNGLTAIASGHTIDDDGNLTVNNLSVTTLDHNNILNITYKHNDEESILTSIKYNANNQYFEFYVSGKIDPYIVPAPPVIVTITGVINSSNTVTLTANVSNLQSGETINMYSWYVNNTTRIHTSVDSNTTNEIDLDQYRNDTVTVIVNTNKITGINSADYLIPSVNIDGIVSGDSVTITATTTNIDQNTSYVWSFQNQNQNELSVEWNIIHDYDNNNTTTISLSSYKNTKIRVIVNSSIESNYYIVPFGNIDGGVGGRDGSGSESGGGGGSEVVDEDSK